MNDYVADITVGKNRWRWWADVRVRPEGAPPDAGKYERGAHDVFRWSEDEVRRAAEDIARRRIRARSAAKPRRYVYRPRRAT